MKGHWRILVVDDEEALCEPLAAWLREDGYTVDVAHSGMEGIGLADQRSYATCFVDLQMPEMDGIEAMAQIRKLQPDAFMIMLTDQATARTAVNGLKAGAEGYVLKPCDRDEITLLLGRLLRLRNLRRANEILRQRLTRRYRFRDVVSRNPRMQAILEVARDLASLPSTILIQGEWGTGKELLARAIHYSGNRADRPFAVVACRRPSENLLRAELFGAGQGPAGKLEQADGGTIFLDNVGDLPLPIQTDLTKVLCDRSFCRMGSSERIPIEARVIAAIPGDPQQAVTDGKLREELYSQLRDVEIRIPPLRERQDDIPLLARHFVERFSLQAGNQPALLSPGLLKMLMGYDWPGNVGELEEAIERAVTTCAGPELKEADFAFLERDCGQKGWVAHPGISLQQMEKQLITATIRYTGGNIKEAASVLGIDRSTLYEKIKRYQIPR